MAEARAKTLVAACTACGLLGIGSWVFYFRAFAGMRGEDWMVFYTAARAALEGKFSIIYDGDRLTAALNAYFAPWLGKHLPLHPFLYPPHFLLVLLPFGAMPAMAGLALFLGLSFALLACALWFYARENDERWIYVLSALVCPMAAITVMLGQNTFLSCAILVGGFGLLERRRPALAGLVLGVLSYKPQLALLAPVALIAMRQWKALAGAVASAMLLMAASLLVFGIEPWRDWFTVMTSASDLSERWNSFARVNGMNIFTYAAFLGASMRLANALQLAAAAIGAAFVYWFHRRPARAELKLVLLLAVTTLSAPHLLVYDGILIEIAATIFLAYGLRERPNVMDSVAAVAAWLIPLINPPTAFAIGVVTPLVIVLFIARVVRRDFEDEASAAGTETVLPAV